MLLEEIEDRHEIQARLKARLDKTKSDKKIMSIKEDIRDEYIAVLTLKRVLLYMEETK